VTVERAAATMAPHSALAVEGHMHFIDILMLWLDSGGVMDARFDAVLPYADILAVSADSILPKVLHIGAQSLTAQALESADPAIMQTFIKNLPRRDRAEITTSLRQVLSTRQAAVASIHRRLTLDDGSVTTVKFARLLLPCRVRTSVQSTRPVVVNIAEKRVH